MSYGSCNTLCMLKTLWTRSNRITAAFSSQLALVSPPLSTFFLHVSDLDLKTLGKTFALLFTIAATILKCDFLLTHNWMLGVLVYCT